MIGGRRSGDTLREFLDRFRRPAAVPAEITDDLGRELEPVFAVLDAIEKDAAALREDEAHRRVADHDATLHEVDRRIAKGRASAESARATVVEEHRRTAEAMAQEIRARGHVEAERVRDRGTSRMPDMVREVAACVREAGG